jgi:hypothetical protein
MRREPPHSAEAFHPGACSKKGGQPRIPRRRARSLPCSSRPWVIETAFLIALALFCLEVVV